MKPSNLKIYARSAALTIEPQMNAAGDTATIGIDAARKIQRCKNYDWQNKITVQVAGGELPTVLSVLLGYKVDCEFKYHGRLKNKCYAVRLQEQGDLIMLSSAESGSIAVPVTPSDLFVLSTLVLLTLQQNLVNLSDYSLLEILKLSYTTAEQSIGSAGCETDFIGGEVRSCRAGV